MKIARIGNLYQPIPATEYGGTQRSMAQMTAFQAALCGHDIYLYAPSDSGIIPFTQEVATNLGLVAKTGNDGNTISIVNKDGRIGRVRLISAGIPSLGYDHPEEAPLHEKLFAELLKEEQSSPFDIIHCHVRRFMNNGITQNGLMHKTIVHQHNATLERDYKDNPYPLICISNSQAQLMRDEHNAIVFDVVYHGLDLDTLLPTQHHAGFLAWLGRFYPKKGADKAIQIAKASGLPLLLAGMTYPKDSSSIPHFEKDVMPYVDVVDENFLTKIASMSADNVRHEIRKTGKEAPIIYCGPANEQQKQSLFGNALGTLFPISWPEPFGRVLIESMACGAPVIGYASVGRIQCGSVSEIIADGVTGYAVNARNDNHAVQLAVEAVKHLPHIDRSQVRHVFERDWSSERVARQIDGIYKKFLGTENMAAPEAPTNQAIKTQPKI